MCIILKKDGIRLEEFNSSKIFNAVLLASDRAGVVLSPDVFDKISNAVYEEIKDCGVVPVADVHELVINEISKYDSHVANCYREYREYKKNFNKTFSNIITGTRKLLADGDKENANKNSELVSTKKELSSGILSKNIALDYELPKDIALAHKNADIHSHDLTDEIYGSINCCLFDMSSLLKNGFKINGVDNTEPKHLETALSTISDVILSASSQQFGNQL